VDMENSVVHVILMDLDIDLSCRVESGKVLTKFAQKASSLQECIGTTNMGTSNSGNIFCGHLF
jgi:hypothetical protein